MRFAEYYDKLCGLIATKDLDPRNYSKLFNYLYSTPFRWTIKNDANRASDGIRLRNSIIRDADISDSLGECRVLEMMIALAIDCEEQIMQEARFGDRTAIWFWTMIDNLGLIRMDDWNYNDILVKSSVSKFLDRRYDRDGHGSIFYVTNRHNDLRRVELWYQMCWFLSEQYNFDI